MNAPFKVVEPAEGAAWVRGAVTVEDVRACRDAGMTKDETAVELKRSLSTITKLSNAGGVVWRRGRKRGDRTGQGARTKSRFTPRAAVEHTTRGMPAVTNPAFTEQRTLYPSMRTEAADALSVLISGFNAWKIGGQVTKGRWKGFPVYTVTLEERATCPPSCQHWRSCYGNQMRFSRRLVAGGDYEARLAEELVDAAAKHPRGFAVRLHVLGDFYSVAYVELWRWFLDNLPALHVFGFTARIDRSDPIAVALVRLVLDRWDRFAIRFSNALVDECSTVTIEHPLQKPSDAVVCPQQLGKTASCTTCGLCWQSRRRIAFLRH